MRELNRLEIKHARLRDDVVQLHAKPIHDTHPRIDDTAMYHWYLNYD